MGIKISDLGEAALRQVSEKFQIKKSRKKPDQKERRNQIQCVNWFRFEYPKNLIFHIPNGGKRGRIVLSLLKAMGAVSGIPDLFIPLPKSGYHGLWVEMKSDKGSLSDEQREIHAYLKGQGYEVLTIKEFESFQSEVGSYMRGQYFRGGV